MSSLLRAGDRVAIRINRASIWYCLLTIVAILAASYATLTMGTLGIPPSELPAALTGAAEGKSAFVFERLRGPRLATAIGVGALLGISGALFQTVTRNPLGSPDVIGLGPGAGAGVAVASLLYPAVPAPLGAVTGAAVATTTVFLCTGKGFRSPARTIIAGVAVAAMSFAITQYVVSAQLRDAAIQLAAYLTGSLNAANLGDVLLTGAALALVLPLAMGLNRHTRMLVMGDQMAAALGTDPGRTRTLAVILSVVAAGAAVAAAGPIAFVALTAPHIAQQLIRSADIGVLPAAVTGALLLVVADLVAQQVSLFAGLPVGVLTLGVGGVHLGYLLVNQHRKGRL
ncbi:FecCD family ABC transporter permease [Natronoglycomyces albus]|uniref:Iron chelate uptake ABC transporter family permease subunit n=1 Tax=Natronoglycomyces albus TaxID=2811108 RepID=A0A895XMG4_9ACTN|nr:iron chelate uptake ABC transporter family permease subunit [Natronoglycomyces albus]QSB06317.1 iron chelate uptake ABC transporter family permease subunit [Natronoglycomyces albus]